jgi:hypothetical protein
MMGPNSDRPSGRFSHPFRDLGRQTGGGRGYRRCLVSWLVSLAACGSVQSPITDGGQDAPARDAAAPDAPDRDGPTFQIAGTIREAGTQVAVAGAAVDVIRISDRKLLGTTTSGSEGMYAVLVPTHNAPVDAYLDVNAPGYLRTHAYLIPELSSDSTADALVISGASLQEYAAAARVQQPANTGFILAQLFESNQQAAGATAAVTPSGTVCYTETSTGLPECALPSTAGDGLVWIFSVQQGTANVSGQLADLNHLQSREVSVNASLFIQIGLEP